MRQGVAPSAGPKGGVAAAESASGHHLALPKPSRARQGPQSEVSRAEVSSACSSGVNAETSAVERRDQHKEAAALGKRAKGLNLRPVELRGRAPAGVAASSPGHFSLTPTAPPLYSPRVIE